MYMVAVSVDCCWSGVRLTPEFQDEFTNGTWLLVVAALTPGIARSICRSERVCAAASASLPIGMIWMRTSSSRAMPLGRFISVMRSPTRNSALQMMAQVSAISRTMSAAAVLCRSRVERIGRMSIRRSPESLRLELDGGRDVHGAPRGKEAGDDAGSHGKQEGGQQHRQVQLRELRIAGRLLADGPQPQQGQAQAEDAAGQADRAGFHQALLEDLAAGCAQRPAHADLAAAAQELGQQQADGVEQADQQEAEAEPQLHHHVARHHAVEVQPLHDVAQADVGFALEAAGGLLLRGIVVEVGLVVRGL